MRLIAFTILLCLCGPVSAQAPHFPVKMNRKWGLMDATGRITLPPQYDAIGEFRAYGYAVMQRQGGVGLLDQRGREVLPPHYEDLRVLDSTLVAVLDLGEWMVIDPTGRVVLPKGYGRVQLLEGGFLAYTQGGRWGVRDRNGRQVLEARHDEVSMEEGGFLLARRGEHLGLYDLTGAEILPISAREIKIFSDSLFFFRSSHLWGAVNHKGQMAIPEKYDNFQRITSGYIALMTKQKTHVYSVACPGIITQGQFDAHYAFSKKYLLVKEKRHLGLVDWCGNQVLKAQYAEVQPFDGNRFRVSKDGRWGIVGPADTVLLPLQYDYIAPLRGNVCVLKKDGKFGLANAAGQVPVQPTYARIVLEEGRARAYRTTPKDASGESFETFTFDTDGNLQSRDAFHNHFTVKIASKTKANAAADAHYQLDRYEWFYSPANDRWGLRALEDGSVQIEPKFHQVQVEHDLGFTLVGMEKNGHHSFEYTRFRFDMVYGLVNNEVGLLVTEMNFWDVRFDDFRRGYPVARCVFADGRHGLVDRIGRIVRKDFAFIGEFRDGLARMSMAGTLSGSTNPQYGLGKVSAYLASLRVGNYMLDYTEYDRIFLRRAALVCEGCQWGYIDTAGQVAIPAQYGFARDFESQVGMVEQEGKWGMIDQRGGVLIPCRYDGIRFLEKTDNQIVQVYVQAPKYGLVDTLGQLAVRAVYDEVGEFAEGRLAVKRGGAWGFVDAQGTEVIPCRFREVQPFCEGLAAVKMGRQWGFIGLQGAVAIDFKYRKAGNFSEGLAWVATDEGVGFITPQEAVAIPPRFERAQDFQHGVARVGQGNKWGLVGRDGRVILKPKYTDIGPFGREGLAAVLYGSKQTVAYGFINLRGEKITRTDYVQVQPFSEGMAVVKDRYGFGYINESGTLAIPCHYAKAGPFRHGLAAVTLDGQCGYLNPKGETAIAFAYSRCQDFEDGRAVVYKGMRRAGLLDTLGQTLVEPGIDRLLHFNEGLGLVRDEQYRFYYITEQADLHNGYYERATEFRHGIAVVQINGKWGIINRKGIEVLPPRYDRIEGFSNGYAKVRIEGFNGLVNLKGELIARPDYESITYAGHGLFRVEQGDMVGYFDAQGRWVWDLSK